jgi:hypothetical protein
LKQSKLPFIVWSILAFVVGVKALVSPERHSVWPVFASASQHWWQHESLYNHYVSLDMYRYSPTFAIAITPLAALPFSLGGLIWGAGGILLLYFALAKLHTDVLANFPEAPGQSAFLMLSAIGVAPMAWNLQSNVLVLVLIAFGTSAAARGSWWKAAFLLTAPVFIKLWPVAWLSIVVCTRPRQLGVRTAAAFAGFAALPFLTATSESVSRTYGEWLSVLQVGQGLRWPGYRDLVTILNVIGIDPGSTSYQLLQVSSGAVVLAVTLVAGRLANSYRHGLVVGLTAWMGWQLLLGPSSERNTYGMILPLIAWEAIRRTRTGRSGVPPLLAFVGILGLSAGEGERALGRFFAHSEAALPALVLGYLAWYAFEGARYLLMRRIEPVGTGIVFGPHRMAAAISPGSRIPASSAIAPSYSDSSSTTAR